MGIDLPKSCSVVVALAMSAALGLGPSVARAQQPVQLDTLRVSVSSRLPAGAVTRAVDVIDRAMIERLPTRSVADAIARAIGADVMARSPAQADLSLRGSTSEQVLILVDGVPMNDTQTGHFHLDQAVPLDQVERIEVLRGAGSSLYGTSAMGGIVNIVTRASSAVGARGGRSTARAEAGSFGTLIASGSYATLIGSSSPLTFTAEHGRSDGHRAGTDYETTIMRATFASPAGGGTVRLDAGTADRDFGASRFYAPFPNAFEKTRVHNAGVTYERMFGRVSIEPRATIRRHHDDFVLKRDTPSFYHNTHATTDAGGGVTLRIPVGVVETAIGGETFHSSIVSTNLRNHDETRAAVYGEAAAGVGGGRIPAVTGSAGLRADHSSTYGDFLSPSVALAARLGDRLGVRGSAGRAFRAPTWTDRYYSDPGNRGDSTLQVERAWSYEVGVNVTPATQWVVDLTGYVRDVTNAIDWVKPAGAPASTRWQIVNLQEASFRGAEVRVGRRDLFGVDLTARGTVVSVEAKEAAGLTSKYALRPLTQTASLEVAAPLPFGLTLGVIGSHQRRRGEAAYHLLDARVGWTWREWTVFASGTNLGDQPYMDASAVRAAGRALGLGLRWSDSH